MPARLLVLLTMSLMAQLAACAALDPDSGTGGTGGSGLTVACTNNVNTLTSFLDWELRVVVPETIESGQPFGATLEGVAVFNEAFMDAGHEQLPDGLREINLVDLKATVHVRSGATGDDVVLEPEPIPYECFIGRSACDPTNDVLGDPPKPPGLRGNADCEPEADFNPCGRFIFAPTSEDCAPDGECADLGKSDQCFLHDFCITGGREIRLQEATGRYTASVQGDVLFGWDDESTGATVQEGGPGDGTWNLPPAVYEESTGPNGLRVTVGGFPAAAECTMGVATGEVSSPTPDSELISFRIQMPP